MSGMQATGSTAPQEMPWERRSYGGNGRRREIPGLTTLSLCRARAGVEPLPESGSEGPSAPELPAADPSRLSIRSVASGEHVSYRDWYSAVEPMAAFFLSRGLRRGDRVLILSETRLEWMQADLAIVAAGGLTVPVYPTLPAPQIEEILIDSGARFAVVSRPGLLAELSEAPASRNLETIVLVEGKARGDCADSRVACWPDARARGHERLDRDQEMRARLDAVRAELTPKSDATIIYTSGTEGRVKGVLLTHENLLTSAVSSARQLEMNPQDLYLSFLPLSHVLERVVQFSMVWAGASIHYCEGLDRLEANLKSEKPTVLVGVPRFYEKILREARRKARKKGRVAELIFRMAERAALRAGRRGPGSKAAPPGGWFWDVFVYRRLRRGLGGRVRCLISGGAPLGIREALFLNGAGFNLLEGYGLTESSSVASVNLPGQWRRGSVGKPLPELEAGIAEDGEILLRGPSIMRGYWNNPEATHLALRDGWLHTGDVGRLDEDGFLYITDRKKDIIVNAQAKKISPQVVEERLRRSPLVREAMVLGDRRPWLAALIYPDLEMLRSRLGLTLSEGPDLVKTLNAPAVVALVRAEVDRHCATLAPHEQVRSFILLPELPGVENGGLTPTMKIRRAELMRRHAAEIAALFRRPRQG